MPTLIDAVLAREVEMEPRGITSIVKRIFDGEEFVRPIPSEFPAMLAVIFSAAPGSVFDVSTEVRSHTGHPLWFDSGNLATPATGRGEVAIEVNIPVLDAGPCVVALRFGDAAVWSQRKAFAGA